MPTVKATNENLARLANSYRKAVDPHRVQQLGRELGLSVDGLKRLGIGWSTEHRAWSFPMTDASGQVRGIRLRRPNGSKFSVTGGHDGLFIPEPRSESGSLLVVEGPTDVAALVEMGFDNVLGRPSCTGGTALIAELVRQSEPREVVIVADADEPGRRGANALASVLVGYVPAVRVIQPPGGVSDAREWLRLGGTLEEVEKAIYAALVRRLQIQTQQMARHE